VGDSLHGPVRTTDQLEGLSLKIESLEVWQLGKDVPQAETINNQTVVESW
jgi:hypothetical protein